MVRVRVRVTIPLAVTASNITYYILMTTHLVVVHGGAIKKKPQGQELHLWQQESETGGEANLSQSMQQH